MVRKDEFDNNACLTRLFSGTSGCPFIKMGRVESRNVSLEQDITSPQTVNAPDLGENQEDGLPKDNSFLQLEFFVSLFVIRSSRPRAKPFQFTL
ncbi:hypothetical protein NPIL_703301 [Nephila pilipes]|uniref:Uncharacterized protein n=1 Tax=Nephila pilipes TaxID=299642 RepID=A0A8X6U4B8_NEPPI|nr:hypothetical protein NPIL_703301 [Nephila pilipes]